MMRQEHLSCLLTFLQDKSHAPVRLACLLKRHGLSSEKNNISGSIWYKSAI